VTDSKLAQVCNAIDQEIVVDAHVKGIISKIYSVAREQNGDPLVFSAGRKISKSIKRGGPIFLLTGFPVPYPFAKRPNEVHSDGPVGIASLAKLLTGRLGVQTLVVTDEGLGHISRGCLKAAFGGEIPHGTGVFEMPKNVDLRDLCTELLEERKPSLLISSEKPSRSVGGEFHAIAGGRLTPFVSRADILFDIAPGMGIPTVAVGDVGNEVGMGAIREAVKQALPNGGACTCPCKTDIIAATHADAVVLGTMSDWGVYGIGAYLACENGDPSQVPGSGEVKAIMDAFAKESNLKDWTELMTDDLSVDCTAACLETLRHIVKSGL
jgi:hypothetical protein